MRNEPRISVSKLGEYLRATPRRRRSIVADQKNPKDFIVIWYREARQAVVECLLNDGDLDRLREAHLLLEDELAIVRDDSHHARRIQVSLEAIDAFADSMREHALTTLDLEPTPPIDEQMVLGGVRISVRPDFLVRTSRGVGAVFLYFNKSHPLSEVTGAYVAALIHKFVRDHLGDEGKADRSACQVIDVMQGEVYVAPKSFKNRLKDVEAACLEIAAVWPGA